MIYPSGRNPALSGATRYDGATAGPVVDASGQYKPAHPVDQMVALSFCMSKGDCAAAPEVGTTLSSIKYLSGETLAAEVELHVMTSYPFSVLVESGRVTVKSIEHEVRDSGDGLAVVVNYVNEELGREDAARWYS